MNELSMLKKENRLRIGTLMEDDRMCIGRITQKAGGDWLNPFDMEIARKELIGMALEARERGSTLEKALGVTEEEFCAELLKNCGRASAKDVAFYYGRYLREICWFFLIGLPLYNFLSGSVNGFLSVNLPLYWIVFLIIWPVVGQVLRTWLWPYYLYGQGLAKYSYHAAATTVILLFLLLAGRLVPLFDVRFDIPFWAFLALFGGYALLFTLAYRRYIHKLAESCHWKENA